MFVSHYLQPMGSAIWSTTLQEMRAFPLLFFVRFFKNHGLLSVKNRPQWRVIQGGSSRYLQPLLKGMEHRVVTEANINHVLRDDSGVSLEFGNGGTERFDQVVFACHSDQALSLLLHPSSEERQILGAIPYRNNQVVLHTDENLLPRNKLTWSSWNYLLQHDADGPPTLSYNMNILQGLDSTVPFIVSLNPRQKICEQKALGEYQYAHPVFTLDGVRAQARWQEINGARNTWYCGAYWRNGFHEDGCVSGIRVAQALGAQW